MCFYRAVVDGICQIMLGDSGKIPAHDPVETVGADERRYAVFVNYLLIYLTKGG